MQVKNVVSNNLKEFVLALEDAIKQGYSVVVEGVDFQSGFFKALVQKEDSVLSISREKSMQISKRGRDVLVGATPVEEAVEMLNTNEPNELKEILELGEQPKVEIQPAEQVVVKPKRNSRK